MPQAIPDPDHIARHCPTTQCPEGDVQATAFMRKEGESGLSVNWLEYLDANSREGALRKLCAVYKNKGRTVRPAHWFAILNAGQTRRRVQREMAAVELVVEHDPQPEDGSHSEIRGLPGDKGDAQMVAELLAELARECGAYSARGFLG